jgi:hypothetical protein
MRTLIEILAGLAILSNAVIYGTDVFGAIIQRPASPLWTTGPSPSRSATSIKSPTFALRQSASAV